MRMKRQVFTSPKRGAEVPRFDLPQAPAVPPQVKRSAHIPRKSSPLPFIGAKRAPVPLSFGKRDVADRIFDTRSVYSEEDSMDLRDPDLSDVLSYASSLRE